MCIVLACTGNEGEVISVFWHSAMFISPFLGPSPGGEFLAIVQLK